MGLPGKLLLSAAALLLLSLALRFYRSRSCPAGKIPRENRDGDGNGDNGDGDRGGDGVRGLRRRRDKGDTPGERSFPKGQEEEEEEEKGEEPERIPGKSPLGAAGRGREPGRDPGWKLGWEVGVKSESKAGTELGRDPGNGTGGKLGIELGKEPGSQPGNGLGIKPGNNPGGKLITRSGNEPGRERAREPGTELGNELGSELGNKVGIKAGMELGSEPGSEVGRELESKVGIEVGNEPGVLLGREPGVLLRNKPGILLGSELGRELGSELGILLGSEPGIFPGSQPGSPDPSAMSGAQSSPAERDTLGPESPGICGVRTAGDGCAQSSEPDLSGGGRNGSDTAGSLRTLSVTSRLGLLLTAGEGRSDTSHSFSSVATIQVWEKFIPERRNADTAEPPGPGLRSKVYDYFVQSVSESVSRATSRPFLPPGSSRSSGTRDPALETPGIPNASCTGMWDPGLEIPEIPNISYTRTRDLALETPEIPNASCTGTQETPEIPNTSCTGTWDPALEIPEIPNAACTGRRDPDLEIREIPNTCTAPEEAPPEPPSPGQKGSPAGITETPGEDLGIPALDPAPSRDSPALRVHLGNCWEVLSAAKARRLRGAQDAALQAMSDHLLQVLRSPGLYGRLNAGEREQLLRRRARGRPRLVVADVPPAGPGDNRGRLCYYDEDGDRWHQLCRLPAGVAGRGCAVASWLNYLFLAPGCDGDTSVPSGRVLCYDPAAGSWHEVSPLRQARPRCRLVALDGHLYAIGGECLATMERYDPRRDRWAFTAPLPGDAFAVGHAAAACDGDIFVTGGTLRSRLLRYHARHDRWSFTTAVGDTDRTAELVSVGGFLYRFQLRRGTGGSEVTVWRCSASAGLWYRCAHRPLPEPAVGLRCAALGGLVHCLARGCHLRFLADPGSPRFGAKELRPFPEPHGSLLPAVLVLPESGAETEPL